MLKSTQSTLILLIGGFLAGFANGLLGAGGGIIIVFALSLSLKEQSIEPRDMFANALSVMLPISIVSTAIYALKGSISLEGFELYIIPALAGGIAGGFLLDRINQGFLKKLFSIIIVYSGIMLIVR